MSDLPNGGASIREVHTLLDQMEDRIVSTINARFDAHERGHGRAWHVAAWSTTTAIALAATIIMLIR